MKLGDALQYYLVNDTTIADLVDDRVYAIHAPQDCEFPLITFQHIGGRPLSHMPGDDMTTKADRYQIQAWGKSLEDTQDLAAAIKTAIAAAGRTCPTPFVFSNDLQSHFVVDGTTTLRGRWNCDYDKNNSRIAFKKDSPGEVWQYSVWKPVSPVNTSFNVTMITPLDSRAHVGNWDWYVQNKDVCENQESSSQHRFSIGWNAIEGKFTITIIS